MNRRKSRPTSGLSDAENPPNKDGVAPPQEPETLPEINCEESPDFETHEDLEWWLFEKHAEQFCGKNMWLYSNSQKLPGFSDAIESVKRGLIAFNVGNAEPAMGPIDFTEAFFVGLRRNPDEALRTFHTIVGSAASRGDVDFFNRMQREIRKGKRRSEEKGALKFHLLTQWVHGFLWLMSDDVGYSYLRFRSDFSFSFAAFQKERSRLGLVGYETFFPHPIIIGHDLDGRFTFRDGWTNLEPTLSK